MINTSVSSIRSIIGEHNIFSPDLSWKLLKELNSIESEKEGEFKNLLKKTTELLTGKFGVQNSLNFINHLEITEGIRKPTIAIYDHAFHFIGGAQKYGITLIKALEDKFDITIISNRQVSHENFSEWYGIDTTGMTIKIIPLPYFEKRDTSHIAPHRILKGTPNPFHRISFESGNYDIFINNGMLEMVYPLSLISVMICHFPERRPESYFYSDRYTYTVYNSKYTGEWIKKRWKFVPHKHIYPPVDMEIFKPGDKKKKLIVSVARFEEGGTKKQKEMALAFIDMKKKYPDLLNGWELILAGGSTKNNIYLADIEDIIKQSGINSIKLRINITDEELKDIYKKSSIFWHLCGLGQDDPAKVEHFGMTIGEAMQNRIIPVVFDGGGQKEIVEHGSSGFRVASISGLIDYTLTIIKNGNFPNKMSESSYKRSKLFKKERFIFEVKEFFSNIIPGSPGKYS